MTQEEIRLEESRQRKAHWKRWGPYLSDRQWGTVREDYSPGGTAWAYFPHDHARSRAYRWGEDGLAGVSDNHQRLCFALALWNGRDPILKERLFGVTGNQGNHGEDVKEYYFYLDSTPTHSYMKYLYKYPQRAYPYAALLAENARRDRRRPEYELLDTGVFADNRYFDVVVEYAKATVDDLLIRVAITNRGAEPAEVHVLPTLWFRNTWAWEPGSPRPRLCAGSSRVGWSVVAAEHAARGRRVLRDGGGRRVLGGCARGGPTGLRRDALEQAVLSPRREALAHRRPGTTSAAPGAPERAQRPVDAPLQRRHRLHAGQVGVSVVRGVGPRVPHDRAGTDRSRLREVAAHPLPARVVHAPQRPDPRLRVGIRRRQSAGARVGRVARVQDRPARDGCARPRLSREGVPEAPAQFHVVGQPQGHRGQKRLRERLPRARQHRRLRPLGAAAHGRTHRAVRRHLLDGHVLPEHARHRAGAVADEPGLRRHRLQVLRALRLHRQGDERPRRRGDHPLGRDGRLLLRRPAHRRRGASAQDPLDGRADSALRGGDAGAGGGRAAAGLHAPHAVVHRQPAGVPREPRHGHGLRRRRAPAAVHRQPYAAHARAALHARPRRVPVALRDPRAVALSPSASLRADRGRRRAPRGLRARRVHHGILRRQLELARPRLVPGELPVDRVSAEVPPFLRRRSQGRVPERLAPAAQSVGRRGRAVARPHPPLPARPRRPASRARRRRHVPDRPELARPPPLLRILPRRRRRRHRRQSPDGLDRPRRQAHPAERRVSADPGRRPEAELLTRHLGRLGGPHATGVAAVVGAMASAAVRIADALARAAVDGRTGGAGTVNVQGEAVKKLDLWANDAVRDALAATGAAYLLVSEEMEAPLELGGAGGYVVCFDPVDGSSNLDINGVVGTIFSVRARSGRGPERDAVLPGTAQG